MSVAISLPDRSENNEAIFEKEFSFYRVTKGYDDNIAVITHRRNIMSLAAEYIKLIKSGRARMEPGLRIDDIKERLEQNGYPLDRIEILLDGDAEEETRFEKWLEDQDHEQKIKAEVQRLKALMDPFGPKQSPDDTDEQTLRDLQDQQSKVAPEPEPDDDDMSPFPDPTTEMRNGPRPR
ncbi:MAG: hypothetical protein ABJN42_03750 [Roseibium sp.]|uniref:hypothetical protein n=1 Tax=Roseibium sp. TaxID=1936156 RepID=UPI003297C795